MQLYQDQSNRQTRFLWRPCKQYLWLFLLLWPPAWLHAKPSDDSLFHQSYAIRSAYYNYTVFPHLQKMPVNERVHQMDMLQQRAQKERDYEAELQIIIGRYLLEGDAGPALNRKLAVFEALLNKLDEHKFPEYRAVIMSILGNTYFGKKQNYTRAFDHLINAYNIARQFSQEAFPDKKDILAGCGNRYYSLGDYERAKQILLEANTLNDPLRPYLTYNVENTLGLVYRSQGRYDTAIRYFRQAEEHAAADSNRIWVAIVRGNIGITYYKQGDYNRAVPLLKEDIAHCLQPLAGSADNGINSLLILADIHLKQGDLTAVAADIQLTELYLDSCRDKIKPLGMLYPVMARYYFQQGDYKTAYRFQDSAATYRQILYERDNIYQLAKVEHKKDIERAGVEIKRLGAEKKLLAFTRNGLVTGIVLLLIITALIINRQRLKHKMKHAAMQAHKEQAEHDLQTATRQLENFTRHLQEKNLLIEQSGQEIQRLQATLEMAGTEEENNEVLQQLYSATILTDEEWNEFRQLFDQVHKGYLQRLKSKMPELTPADTRFIVLTRLNLSNKEMASILGVQGDTIRSYKHRLRKRFGLPEQENIKAFVDAI